MLLKKDQEIDDLHVELELLRLQVSEKTPLSTDRSLSPIRHSLVDKGNDPIDDVAKQFITTDIDCQCENAFTANNETQTDTKTEERSTETITNLADFSVQAMVDTTTHSTQIIIETKDKSTSIKFKNDSANVYTQTETEVSITLLVADVYFLCIVFLLN